MSMNKKCLVVFSDGSQGLEGDFPIAVIRNQDGTLSENVGGNIVDPLFNGNVTRNLYGRIMTLVEATTDGSKLKSVKDIFSKELRDWERNVYDSAREIAGGGNSSSNIYNFRSYSLESPITE